MASALRWSAPPPEIVRRIVAGQAITFWVESMRMVRANVHAHFVFMPFTELELLGGSAANGRVLPGVTREHWLVWQPLSGVGVTTLLPVEPGELADALKLPSRDPATAVYREGLREVMEALYAYRAV